LVPTEKTGHFYEWGAARTERKPWGWRVAQFAGSRRGLSGWGVNGEVAEMDEPVADPVMRRGQIGALVNTYKLIMESTDVERVHRKVMVEIEDFPVAEEGRSHPCLEPVAASLKTTDSQAIQTGD
jgi:hypothetical protein